MLAILSSFSLLASYQNYLDFKRFSWHTMDAQVVSETKLIKNDQTITRYKLTTSDFSFRTSSKEPFKTLENRNVRITLFTNKISFLDYLKGFYTYTKFEGLLHQKSTRKELLDSIQSQHTNKMIANLYGALYLAQAIDPELRKKLSDLGINHLAAISGFHLGFIAFFVLLLAKLIYTPLHQRFLPYRNRTRDVMLMTLIVVAMYVVFLEFTPSLLRAFGMMLIGFILYDRGIKILSFHSLLVTVLLLIALFPDLLFSMGFWFSVLGVFNLFLIIKHWGDLPKWQLFIILHVAVFILMIPWVIYFFGSFSLGQLLSPLLSMLFILFYPLSVFAILIGIPTAFDSSLHWLFSFEFLTIKLTLSFLMILLYMGLLVASMISKRFFYLNVLFISFGMLYVMLDSWVR
jgi:competence protein ComEC